MVPITPVQFRTLTILVLIILLVMVLVLANFTAIAAPTQTEPVKSALDPDSAARVGVITSLRTGSNLSPQVIAVGPPRNALNVSSSASITATFNVAMNASTVTTRTMVTYGAQTGRLLATVTYNDVAHTATLDPAGLFKPGEVVWTSVTSSTLSTDGTSITPTVWQFTTQSVSATANFSDYVTYTVGTQPEGVAIGDLNGDGYLDLVVANTGSNTTISVLLNHDDGTFASQVLYTVGSYPDDVTVGDLDADGDLDLAVANWTSNNVSVLRNRGDGTFFPQTAYPVGAHPLGVITADLDGDGYLDLATANNGSSNISVLFNRGDGTFAIQTTYSVMSSPHSVAAGDFDGDGTLDLAVVNCSSNTVSVLLNRGNGSFLPQVPYTVGRGPWTVTPGDLDRDGDLDLIVTNEQSASVSVLRNNGNGTFATQVTYATGTGPSAAILADLDGDGNLDIATANGSSHDVSVLRGNGNGTFAVQVKYFLGNRPFALAAGDVDGDGDLDLVSSNYNGNIIWVLRNGVGYSISGRVADASGDGIAGVTIADNKGHSAATDTSGDYALRGLVPGSYTITPTKSGYIFTPPSRSVTISAANVTAQDFTGTPPIFEEVGISLPSVLWSAIAWGDYDGDGDPDILLSGCAQAGTGYTCRYGTPVTRIYRNDGGAVFTDINAGLKDVFSGSVAWGDYDRDGDLDILLTGLGAGETSSQFTAKVYRNDGGRFTDINAGLVGVYASSAEWGDYDGDGYLDIVLQGDCYYCYTARVYHNNRNGTFTDIKVPLPDVASGSIAWSDYDGDGDLDILTTGCLYTISCSSRTTKIFRNDGGGHFSDTNASLMALGPSRAYWGDYNRDNRFDILLLGCTGANWCYGTKAAKIYRNTGGAFTDINAALMPASSSFGGWVDYDRDGDLDALVAGCTGTESGSGYPAACSALATKLYRNDAGTFSDASVSLPGLFLGAAAWGDYDKDGDPDLLITGRDSTGQAVTKLFRNNTAAVPTYVISGRVMDASGNGIAGVTISDDKGHSTTTDANGNYSISGFSTGTYTITPSKSGYAFTPTTRTVTITSANVTGQDFVGRDMVAPATITDLSATTGTDPGDIVLRWTAPGGDGMQGRARRYDLRQSATPIDARDFSSAESVGTVPDPEPGGTVQTFIVHVPFPGKLYHFAVKAMDDGRNWSEISNLAQATSGTAQDLVPPERVTSLQAYTGSAAGAVRLEWTAPQDLGGGQVTRYEVHYNREPINGYNWTNATIASGPPPPGAPGAQESMSVNGLEAGRLYFFALRAFDSSGNGSGVSTCPSAKAGTASRPLPDLLIESLTVSPTTVNPGQSIDVQVGVRNSGTALAGANYVAIYWAGSRTGSDREPIGGQNIMSIAAGETRDVALTLHVPSNTSIGSTHYVVAKADRDDAVEEMSKANNEWAEPVAVPGLPRVDLSILDIEVTQGIQVFNVENFAYQDAPKYGVHPHPNHPPWDWVDRGPGNNELHLVQGRTTIARVFVSRDKVDTEVRDIAVKLEYSSDGQWIPVGGTSSVTLPAGMQGNVLRKNGKFASFILPGSVTARERLLLRATLTPPATITDGDASNDMGYRGITMAATTAPQLVVVPIHLTYEIGSGSDKQQFDVGIGDLTQLLGDGLDYAAAALPFPYGSWRTARVWSPIDSVVYESDCSTRNAAEQLVQTLESDWREQFAAQSFDVVVGVFPTAINDFCQYVDGKGLRQLSFPLGLAQSIGLGHAVIVIDRTSLNSTLTHELSHLIPGLRHLQFSPSTPGAQCDPEKNCPTWPRPGDFHIREVGVAITDFTLEGIDKRQGEQVEERRKDVMATDYAGVWPAPYTWEAWMAQWRATPAATAAALSTYAAVSGSINKSGSASIEPLWLSAMNPAPAPTPGDYCIQTLTQAGAALNRVCFEPEFMDRESGDVLDVASFLVGVPFNVSVGRMQLWRQDVLLKEVTRSASAPAVTVTAPNGSESLTQPFTLTWTASDADSDPLIFRVLFSADDGATWRKISSDMTGLQLRLDPADLPGTAAGRFKVVTSDGFNLAEDISDAAFTVGKKAPRAWIASDLSAASVTWPAPVILRGYASDAEDGVLPGTAYAWASDRDGVLGVGPTFTAANLSVGIHRITFTVTDSDGMAATDSVYLEIVADADADRLPDAWERMAGLDPTRDDAADDADGEGLTNAEEYRYGADPWQIDTDHDGFDDLIEIVHGSDPLDPKSTPVRGVYLPLVVRGR